MPDRKRPRRGDSDGSRNWRGWSRDLESQRFEGDLGEVETEVDGFGNSAQQGFAEAWSKPNASGSSGEDALGGADLPEDLSEDRRAIQLRRFERRWSPAGIFGVAILVALFIGAVIFARATPDRAQEEAAAATELLESQLELALPGEQRSYGDGPAVLNARVTTPIEQGFLTPAGAGPEPVTEGLDGLPANASYSLAFWGGRTHVAVAGDGLGQDGNCVVVSLFSDSFDVVDVAAAGDCGSLYGETGDRTACRSSNAVMIEVWPENPTSLIPTPTPTQVRVRIEQVQADGDEASVRSTQQLDQSVQRLSQALSGPPGIQADFVFGDVRGGCELLDRSGVEVRFL